MEIEKKKRDAKQEREIEKRRVKKGGKNEGVGRIGKKGVTKNTHHELNQPKLLRTGTI